MTVDFMYLIEIYHDIEHNNFVTSNEHRFSLYSLSNLLPRPDHRKEEHVRTIIRLGRVL